MPPQPSALTAEQKDLQNRIQLFDQEFQALQKKYLLRISAQVVFPGGAVLSCPIQAFPIQEPIAPADEATKPE